MNHKIAVFPGSFDPFTKGHLAIVLKAINLFDGIIIAIGDNSSKTNLFSLTDRLKQISSVFQNEPKVTITSFTGLTVDFCRKNKANFIVRGLRDNKDFEYEKSIAIMNNQVEGSIETVFLMTDVKYLAINSVIIRDILKNGGNVSKFLPNEINDLIAGA